MTLSYLTWDRPAGLLLSMTDVKEWQAGRCAFCGSVPRRLVLDHCHDGGWPRGYLCDGCNTAEGRDRARGGDPAWATYRRYPPAVLYGVRSVAEGGPLVPRVKLTGEQISAMKRRAWQASYGSLTTEERSDRVRRAIEARRARDARDPESARERHERYAAAARAREARRTFEQQSVAGSYARSHLTSEQAAANGRRGARKGGIASGVARRRRRETQ